MVGLAFIGRHKVGAVSTVLVLVAVLALLAYALSAPGYAVHKAELNDGGVWVTSSHDGEFARLNKPVGQFDGALYLGSDPNVGHNLDVLQAGSAVAAWDRTSGQLAAVDVTAMAAAPGQPATVPPHAAVAIGGDLAGGTLAVLDTEQGRLWAMRVDPGSRLTDLSALDRSSPPIDSKIGATSALTVSPTGTIFAVSAAGRLTTIQPSGAGFAQPQVTSLGGLTGSGALTAVGRTPVVLDGQRLLIPGHSPVTVPGSGAVLQQSGPATSAVLVATTTALYSVALSSAQLTTVAKDGTGSAPAAPVQLGGCTFAAWTGSPAVFRNSCPTVHKTNVGRLTAASSTLVYRVNRQQLVLSDPDDGNVWNVDGATAQQVADWAAVAPPPKPDSSNKHEDKAQGVSLRNQPPKAVPDTLGARPGRTSTLHVLDNDSDPAGNILGIDNLSKLDNPSVQLAIAPDEQTIAITLPAAMTTAVHFSYEINDGKGQHASAEVSVTPTLGSANVPPRLCTCYRAGAWSVGVSSVLTLPIVGDWRDGDGDPITLISASTSTVNGASVSSTPDGDLVYRSPRVPPPSGVASVSYTVSDGFGGKTSATLDIRVLAVTSTAGTPPIAAPDVAKTIVGQSVTIAPLANDLPGTDPTSADPQLQLASPIQPQPGASVVTDLQHGLITFKASRAAVFVFSYTVSYGAQSASGKIRVDVAAPPRTGAAVVAMPDTAVLYGQQPTIVDVLANDYDPSGNVLVVQQADPVSAASGLRASVVDGKWLSVVTTDAAPAAQPQLVRYTVTDGLTAATGEVAVTELARPAEVDHPIARADQADVRAADSVTIAVLDNDIDPDGAALSLVPGSVQVQSGGGQAYVSDNLVRYVAPATVAAGASATVGYSVTNGTATDNGTATVTIHPLPAEAAASDAPPVPLPITTSTVAGGAVVVKIPTSGVDPDGDSVTLTGIDAPGPHLGEVTAMTADSLTYRAFPNADNAGTDTIGYRVVDRFGVPGTALIQIGVVPPGTVQPPVATDDSIDGAPNAQLAVNVVANDFVAPGDAATVSLAGDVGGARVDPKNKSVIRVTAPGPGRTTVVPYQLDDGSGRPSSATLTVHGVDGYDNPPVARDDSAKPAAANSTTATVDVLANDSDPDVADRLVVTRTFTPTAKVVSGKVVLSLTALPQSVVYEISDGHKTAAAVIFVPAAGAGAPYVKPGALIKVPAGASTKSLDINSYLVDPARKRLTTTFTDKQSAAPSTELAVRATGPSLVLTGRAGYVGPASVTLQVTDGASPSAVGAATGYVSIPVQVGDPTPVLRCPTTSGATLYQGGSDQSVDVPSVCNVWLPNAITLDSVVFTAHLAQPVPGVSVRMRDSRTLTLSPNNTAKPGEQGVVLLGIKGSSQQQRLSFSVQAAPAVVLRPIAVSGLKVNEAKTVAIGQYATSPFRLPKLTVLSCTKTSGLNAACSVNGGAFTVKPADAARGVITFELRVSDEPSDPDRTVTGLLTLNVLGHPAAPASVTANANRTQGGQVQVAWPTPSYDGGAPIDYFTVRYTGGSSGSTNCGSSPCTIAGLHNGAPYTFSVSAHNGANLTSTLPDPRSNPVTPDTKPDQVTGVAVTSPVADRTLTITWSNANNHGSAITHYIVVVTDVGTHTPGTRTVVSGVQPSFTTRAPLTNDDPYEFKVAAQNADGIGSFSVPIRGQSASQPTALPAPTVPSEDPTAPSAQVSVAITWSPAPDANGPGVTSYTVHRGIGSSSGASALAQCVHVAAQPGQMSCTDTVPNDGKANYYAVTATNGANRESAPTNFARFDAVGKPGPITDVAAAASASTDGTGANADTGSGYNGAVHVRFTVPAANGQAIKSVQYSVNGGSWTSFPGSSWPSGTAEDQAISGLVNGTSYTVVLQVSNEKNASDPSPASNPVTPYGPALAPAVNATSNGPNVTYSQTCGSNGRPIRSCQARIDGGGLQTLSPNPLTANRGYNYAFSISGTAVDTAGQSASSGTVSSNTGPPPSPTVTASKGATGTSSIGSCTTTTDNCHWLNFQVHNFPPGTYSWSCISNNSDSYDSTRSNPVTISDPNQSFSGNGYCLSGVGVSEAIRINSSPSYTSNAVS